MNYADYFVIGLLVTLLIGQQAYWSYQVSVLIDKLMAGSYQNYATTKKYVDAKDKPKLQSTPSELDEVIDPANERQAQELNSLFGIV